MRVTALPLFLYSLSLVAVVAGQSAQVTDTGLSDITDALPTPTETSATDTESDSSTTETEDPTSTSTDEEPTSTPAPTSTDEDTSTTTTEDPTQTTDEPTSTGDDNTTTDPPTTTTSTSDDSEPSTTKPPTVSTITTTQTIDGTPVPTTFTSTDASEATESPGLSGSSSDNSDSGLDSNQKKIIIGVVVGVGGAILIGAIGVVVWRIRARRRAAGEDDATDLMSGTAVGTGVREKAPSPAAGGTPFRSTLDQYHNPGPVNAASNF